MTSDEAPPTQGLTARDFATLNRVADPQLSPDGRWLAFVVHSADWEGNRGIGAVWILDLDTPDPRARRLEVSDKPAWHPRWSPDGLRLYYLSARSGSAQVWRTGASLAVGIQVTALPASVDGFRLSEDGAAIVVALTVPADLTVSGAATGFVPSAAEATRSMAFEHQPVRVWDTWQTGSRTNLYRLTLSRDGLGADELVPLMTDFASSAPERPGGNHTDYVVSSQQVIFSALEPGGVWGVASRYRLYVTSLDGSQSPTRLCRDEDEPPDCHSFKPTLSPDGSRLAFIQMKPGSEEARRSIIVRSLTTGSQAEICTDFDRSPDALLWASDGRKIYAIAPDQGNIRLFAIDVESGTVRALTGAGEVTGVAAAVDRLVVVRSSLGAPGDLYEISTNGERRLTAINADRLAAVALSPFEQFSFAGWNDEMVHGYVVKPHGYQSGRRYPVAFIIHGGPYASMGDGWHDRWNAQVWAGMGLAVVMIDFHGSAGYGEAFGRAIVGHWGDRPLEDLQKGWAAALAAYDYLDGERACALGPSYGGYMVAWMAGVWNEPWRCFVLHNAVVDVRSWALTSDVPQFASYYLDVADWESGVVGDHFNPLTRAGDWRKPMMMIGGGLDFRVPFSQSLIAFNVAQRRSVPSRLVRYADENHFVLKPQNLVDWYQNIEDWIRRWV